MKQKLLRLSPEFLLMTCKHGTDYPVKVINPIPEDSKFIRVFQSGTFNDMYIVISSESFPELKEGDEIPEIIKPLFELLNK